MNKDDEKSCCSVDSFDEQLHEEVQRYSRIQYITLKHIYKHRSTKILYGAQIK